MSQLHLEIITPEKILVKEDVDMVEAVGTLGEFGVLPGHTRFLTTLGIGEIRYTGSDGKTKFIATSGGFAEVLDETMTILVETAEYAEAIDLARARRAEERAMSKLKELTPDLPDYRLYELALLRAIARIRVADKKL